MRRRINRNNAIKRRDPIKKAAELRKNAAAYNRIPQKVTPAPARKSNHIKGTSRRNVEVLEAGSPQFYASAYTKTWTDAEVRKWYTEKRKVIQKRIKRIMESEEYKNSRELQDMVEEGQSFLAAKETPTEEMRSKLLAMASFISNKHSTISGYRETAKKAAATLKAHGIDVEAKDLKNFGNFMKIAKIKSSAVSTSHEISGKVAYGFSIMRRMNLNTRTINKKFTAYMRNIDTIDKMINAGADAETISRYVNGLPDDPKNGKTQKKRNKMKRKK